MKKRNMYLLWVKQNLANHVLDRASPTPLQLTHKPLIQFCVNALRKMGKLNNTINYVKPEK